MGESVATQTSARLGGVIPSFAMGFHAEALPKITKDVLKQATGHDNVSLDRLRDHGVEYVAVTTHPGMSGSLATGLTFAKYLCIKNQLPMIPIHHMEAHALTPRMTDNVGINVSLVTNSFLLTYFHLVNSERMRFYCRSSSLSWCC